MNTQVLADAIKTAGFYSFIQNGTVFVSAEHGDDAADYYGEGRGGRPWINPKLDRLAYEFDCLIEWVNPGCIGFYPV